MIKILVPTDFSGLSKVAIRYAIRFAGTVGGEITLLHVVEIVEPATASMRMRVRPVEKELVDTAKKNLSELADEFRSLIKPGIIVNVKVAKGYAYSEIVQKEAKKVRAGMIVMATRGATGLKKYIIGSNTASVIDASTVPVLAVPELAEFKSLRNVVYATDLTHTAKELRTLLPYFAGFESIVHLIHVTSSARQIPLLEKKIDSIIEKTKAPNVIVRILVNKKVGDAIDQYVTTVKADLLATFTQEHGFYDKLFNRSLTREIAFQSKIPLLAFKQKKMKTTM